VKPCKTYTSRNPLIIGSFLPAIRYGVIPISHVSVAIPSLSGHSFQPPWVNQYEGAEIGRNPLIIGSFLPASNVDRETGIRYGVSQSPHYRVIYSNPRKEG